MAKMNPKDVQIGFCDDGYIEVKAPANFEEAKNPVRGVRGIDIRMRYDEIPTARMQLFIGDLSIKAKPRFVVTHPKTGENKELSELIFADGTTWSAE